METIRNIACKSVIHLSSVSFSDKESYSDFYVKFRSEVQNLLKKKGDKVNYLGSGEMLDDEIISPTFEDVIIVWCLEKIDPKLPAQVEKQFMHQIDKNFSLKDMRQEIFNNIPQILGVDGNQDYDQEKDSVGENSDPRQEEQVETVQSESMENFEMVSVKSELTEDVDVAPVDTDSTIRDTNFATTNVSDSEIYKQQNTHFYCNLCDTSLPSKVMYEHHMLRHNDCKCDICGKSHSSLSRLNEHRKTHENFDLGKKFVCPVCGDGFDSPRYYNRHLTYHKTNNKTYQCGTCDLVFLSRKQLEGHKKNVHVIRIDKVVRCELCNKDIKKTCWDRHLRKHSLMCRLCDIQMVSLQEFKAHKCRNQTIAPKVSTPVIPANENQIKETVNQENADENSVKVDAMEVDDNDLSVKIKTEVEEDSLENADKETDLNDSQNGMKYKKEITVREIYRCIVCQKDISNRENLEIHMQGHFPGRERTALFAQLMLNMKPIQVIQTESLVPILDPVERLEVKLEVEESEHKEEKPTVVYTEDPLGEDTEKEINNFPTDELGKMLHNEHVHKHHKLNHSGCICEECGKSFNTMKKLNHHTRTKHDEPSSSSSKSKFVCSDCGKSLCNKKTLARHMERHRVAPDNKEYE